MLENVDVIGGQTDTGQNCLGGDACVSAHCSPCTSMVPSEASKDHQGISFAKDDATGGKCPVNWITVCSPRRFAGLGITNLDSHSVALRVRWLWCVKFLTRWRSSRLGMGLTSFWHDCWLFDRSLKEQLPDLFKHCMKRNLSIKDALNEQRWIRHLKSSLS
jgi:hypothetical protein